MRCSVRPGRARGGDINGPFRRHLFVREVRDIGVGAPPARQQVHLEGLDLLVEHERLRQLDSEVNLLRDQYRKTAARAADLTIEAAVADLNRPRQPFPPGYLSIRRITSR